MAKSIIGIDISAVETTVAGNGKAYYAQMPNNMLDHNEIVAPESMAKYINDVRKNSGIKAKKCALVLPENAAYYRTINSPVMSDEQIKLNLPYEFRNFIGQDSVKYCFDYFVDSVEYDENNEAQTLHLVAAAGLKSMTEEYARVLKKAGLKLTLALPHEVCLINLMKKTAEKDKEYCLIGVGYDYTNVYMFKGTSMVSTKTIELGNREIDSIIASERKIDEFLAAAYRDKNHENCLCLEALEDVYDRLSLEVMKTINFYKYEHNDSELSHAYFYGLSANNEYLIKSICEHTNLEAGDIKTLLPKEYQNVENAARCLVNIGLTL